MSNHSLRRGLCWLLFGFRVLRFGFLSGGRLLLLLGDPLLVPGSEVGESRWGHEEHFDVFGELADEGVIRRIRQEALELAQQFPVPADALATV